MKIEKHLVNIKESLEVIEECITRGKLVERQRTIGFHVSVASIDMLELYLHRLRLIDPGMQLKHDWFTSEKKVASKLPFDFKYKGDIISLIREIENKRNILCYGVPQDEKIISNYISMFQQLKSIMKKMGVVDG